MNNLPILLEISIHWTVWLSLYYLLLHKKTFFSINRFYLLATLLLGIAIPLIQPYFPTAQPNSLVINLPELVVRAQGNEQVAFVATTNWLSTIYYTGILIASGFLLFNLSKITYQISHLRKQKMDAYWLIELPKDTAPFSFFNYIFVSPKGNYTDEEWTQIITHEQTHGHLLHSIDMLLAEIIKIVFWWNPLVYLYKIALRDVHEFQADQATIQNHNKKEYSRLLFRQSQSGMQTAITSNFIHSQLKKRIKMMMTTRSKSTALLRYMPILPLLIALFFISSQQQAGAQEVESKAELVKKRNKALRQEKNTAANGMDKVTDRATIQHKATEIKQHSKELNRRPSTAEQDTLKQKKGTNQEKTKNNPVYKTVEVMPQFEGCTGEAGNGRLDRCSEKALLNFIYQNIKYPKEARDSKLEGRAIAQFIVNQEGRTEGIEILLPLGGGCDEEILRVLELMNQNTTWTPGRDGGKNVNVLYLLPVKFML